MYAMLNELSSLHEVIAYRSYDRSLSLLFGIFVDSLFELHIVFGSTLERQAWLLGLNALRERLAPPAEEQASPDLRIAMQKVATT